MHIIIVDDEGKARKILFNILTLYCHDAEVVCQADSVESAYKAIMDYRPDLVLLDINLPDGSGFDLLKKFETIPFKLIFITAFEEYAIKAFKYSALDYLLKPVNPQELIQAVEKVRITLENENFEVKYKTFLSNYSEKPKSGKKIILKTSESIFAVDIKDIIRCEADGGYTSFYLSDSRKIFVSKNLKEFNEILAEFNFFRPHYSHLVNLNYMKSYEKRDGGYILMKDNSIVPVSTRRKEELLAMIEKMQ
jgi:two-component system, LytTR family, response regulator